MTQNYHNLKNASILVPATSADLGTPCQPYGNIYVKNNVSLGAGNGIANVTSFSATSLAVPKIQSITYPNTETAANPAGGETITINGSGFLTGLGVYVNNVLMNTSTVVSSNQITFSSPALAAGNYPLSVVNSDGGSATYLFGITYTTVPTWTTAAGSLGIAREGNTISTSVAATDNAQTITYNVTSGSLPSGLTLASNGAITGTLANSASGNTTYNFTLGAKDPQNQVVTRNFSYTVTGDTITWSSPSSGTTFSEVQNVTISNIGLSATSAFGASVTYSATGLPTGLSLSGSNITGTPTVIANSTATISATTATKQANISLTFNVGGGTLSATGGNYVTTTCGYKYHVFTGTSNWTLTAPGSKTINYILVGGGGGGGTGNGGGGGGAGGYLAGTIAGGTLTAGCYLVTVGGGGGGATIGANTSFHSTVAYGGQQGTGERNGYCTGTFGSGGGAGGSNGSTHCSAGFTAGQGHAGGNGYNPCGSFRYGGGGGGAGTAGNNANSSGPATGGCGVGMSIPAAAIGAASIGVNYSGTLWVAAGGGGGIYSYLYGCGANGGKGGGGKGGPENASTNNGSDSGYGFAATVGTGSGGGAAGQAYNKGSSGPGAGASGFAIIYYQYP